MEAKRQLLREIRALLIGLAFGALVIAFADLFGAPVSIAMAFVVGLVLVLNGLLPAILPLNPTLPGGKDG